MFVLSLVSFIHRMKRTICFFHFRQVNLFNLIHFRVLQASSAPNILVEKYSAFSTNQIAREIFAEIGKTKMSAEG